MITVGDQRERKLWIRSGGGYIRRVADQELEDRLRNFDAHINELKNRRKREEDRLQDVEDELRTVRQTHAEKLTDRGQLEAEAKVRRTVP